MRDKIALEEHTSPLEVDDLWDESGEAALPAASIRRLRVTCRVGLGIWS